MFEAAFEATEKKKPHPLLKEIVFDTMEDGKSIQMLHIGSFDDEPASFAKMDKFAKENGLERFNQWVYIAIQEASAITWNMTLKI